MHLAGWNGRPNTTSNPNSPLNEGLQGPTTCLQVHRDLYPSVAVSSLLLLGILTQTHPAPGRDRRQKAHALDQLQSQGSSEAGAEGRAARPRKALIVLAFALLHSTGKDPRHTTRSNKVGTKGRRALPRQGDHRNNELFSHQRFNLFHPNRVESIHIVVGTMKREERETDLR